MIYDQTLEAGVKYWLYDNVNARDVEDMNAFLANEKQTDLAHEFVEDTEEMLSFFGWDFNLDWAH